MERFLVFVKQIRRSRRRKGKKYRPEEDYHEGYEDVYYYASEHLHREKFKCVRVPVHRCRASFTTACRFQVANMAPCSRGTFLHDLRWADSCFEMTPGHPG
ncbi:hypothetical protein E1301_Tti002059 [Triplophysa tibetana]|uniref:Uncharacterized protein n=1 Tax=Triplophysa tibetana TaxID=1572043 RepID=A0A5A9PGG2_9TELE|nr:hypothetical protein E1301_Tti002059 [Triplophysa tibetana]